MPVPSSFLDWAIIRRFTGRATSDDDAIIEAWVASHDDPAHARDAIARGGDALDATLRVRAEVWHDVQWRKLAARIGIEQKDDRKSARTDGQSLGSLQQIENSPPSLRPRHPVWSRDEGRSEHRSRMFQTPVFRVLAAVSLLAGGIVLWQPKLMHLLGPRATVASAPAATRMLVAGSGQHASVVLEDGTRVLLNAGSQLSVAQDMRLSRTVELRGEAMFMVAQHRRLPFVVRVGTTRVTVLGTTFTVRRYPEERRVRVVVADGRVSLHVQRLGSDGDATLGARTLGEVSDSSQILMVTPDVDVAQYTEWTRGRLVFRDVPLRLVIPELERKYGLTIRLADSTLAEQRLQVTITDAPARDVLDLIAMTFGIRYVEQGGTVTFFRSRAQKQNTRESFVPKPEVTYGK